MASTLILGDFEFQDMEVPESLPFGGAHALAIKKMIGGVRDIQALGPDPDPLEWSGIFMPTGAGQSALDRALMVKRLFDAGLPLTLSFGELYYQVQIARFKPELRFYRVPYRISLEVIADLTAPVYIDPQPNADDLIGGDMGSINNLVPGIGDGALSNLTSTLSNAVSAVKTFVGAGISTISSVLQPLNAARAQVQSLIASTDSILNSVASVGGILPGVPITQNILKLEGQINGAARQTGLLQVNGLMGRMGVNLGQINSSVRTVTIASGNLYDLAAKEYGDAMAWTGIAKANKLSDPSVTGITTLVIPPYSNDSSGIPTA